MLENVTIIILQVAEKRWGKRWYTHQTDKSGEKDGTRVKPKRAGKVDYLNPQSEIFGNFRRVYHLFFNQNFRFFSYEVYISTLKKSIFTLCIIQPAMTSLTLKRHTFHPEKTHNATIRSFFYMSDNFL